MTQRADYGIDAPLVVRRMAVLGAAGLLVGTVFLTLARRWMPQRLAVALGITFLWTGVWLLGTAGVMVWGSKVGKVRFRDRLIAGLPWRGDEMVLDVGCGHGLMLIGAAKRLTTGRAVGVDLWQAEDQAGNSPQSTTENLRREGVNGRATVQRGDARDLPFPDGSFDVVLSSWALHNIYDAAGREKAVREIARVLKPGGRAVLVDIRHTAEYARVLAAAGLADLGRRGPNFLFFIPTYAVMAVKPGGMVAAHAAADARGVVR